MIWNQLSPELKFYVHLCLYMSFNSNSTSATSAAGIGNLPEHTQIEVGFVFSVYCFVDHFCRFVFFHCIVCSSSITDFWLSIWYIQDFR